MRQFYRLQASPGSDLVMAPLGRKRLVPGCGDRPAPGHPMTGSESLAAVGSGHLAGQLTCAQVLRLTAAQADTSLMPNSAASCRYVRPSALRARSFLTFPLVSLARGWLSPTAPSWR